MKLQTKYKAVLGTHLLACPMMTFYITRIHYQNQKLIGKIQLNRLQILLRFHLFLNSLNFVCFMYSSMIGYHVCISYNQPHKQDTESFLHHSGIPHGAPS